jgi:hypothetical protein
VTNASIEDTKTLLRDVLVWDAAEKGHMLRANMAKQLGLSPDQYARPFPGSSTVIVMNNEQPQPVPAPAPNAAPQAPAAPAPSVAGAVAAAAPGLAVPLLGGWLPAIVVGGVAALAGWGASRMMVPQVVPITLTAKWQQDANGKWVEVQQVPNPK